MRKEVTDLLLRDFGYDLERADKKVLKMFGNRGYEELSPDEKVRYEKQKAKNQAFDEWFIADERQAIVECLRCIGAEVHIASVPTVLKAQVTTAGVTDSKLAMAYEVPKQKEEA